MDMVFGGLISVAGLLAFFGGIGLLCWLDNRQKIRLRAFENQERLKALEHGQPLPDAEVAKAQVKRSRYRAVGAIGVFVPLFVMATAAGVTFFVLSHDNRSMHIPITSVIWGIAGLVSIIAVTASLSILGHRNQNTENEIGSELPVARRPAHRDHVQSRHLQV